jgi:hypothetical protein
MIDEKIYFQALPEALFQEASAMGDMVTCL